MILLSFSSIDKSYPSGPVLNAVSGVVKNGQRIALLGSNGTGKTTLLEILSGRLDRDSGSVEIPNVVRLSYLPQNIEVSGSEKLFDYALGGLSDLMEIKCRIGKIHDDLSLNGDNSNLLGELGKLQDRFEKEGGYQMESRAEEILSGLGFSSGEFELSLRDLSGGQRNRAALARILISSPDLLLLDEPTNHLDISGLEFLENFITSFKGGIIFVSHDRTFIRNTATAVWELAGGNLLSYPGDYDTYILESEKRRLLLLKSYERQKEFFEKTEDFIRRNIAGQKTRQARSRRRMLAKLRRLHKPHSGTDVASIKFADTERSSRIVVKCEQVAFSYGDNPLLSNLNFEIERGDRIGLFGPNGAGKTTILKLITGDLKPNSGKLEVDRKSAIGYFDQLTEDINPESTPLLTIRETRPEWIEGQIRNFLAKFLFRGDDVSRPVKSFSGGEQSRLALSRLIAPEPNFLLLDEPTNHLDIQSREAFEEAISYYNGTVLCVSHDRYFLDKVVEKIFVIEKGSIRIYIGDYSDYSARVSTTAQKSETLLTGRESREEPRGIRQHRINPQIIAKVERKIASYEEEIDAIEKELAELESSSDWQRLSILLDTRDHLYDRLETLYREHDKLTGE